MAIDINQLKSISQNSIKTIKQYEERESNRGKRTVDTRFWKCSQDEAGNGTALIRFLPALKAGDLPFVNTWSYFIKSSRGRKYYVNKSLKTLNQEDPMEQYGWSRYYATEDAEEKKRIRTQFRANNYYISNILVINDPAHPENNGKVFLYRFGKKIFDKISDKMSPDFADEPSINVFDWVGGCNFKIRVTRNKGDFPNYDSSEFQMPSAMSDEQIEKCAEAMYDLNEFIDPSTFKTYEELQKEVEDFARVDEGGAPQNVAQSIESAPRNGWTSSPAPSTPSAPKKASPSPWESDDEFDSMLEGLDE